MAAGRPSGFNTTHWSLIAALPNGVGSADGSRAEEALRHLCDAYWRPLYAFARFSGHSVQDSEDLTQAFLAEVLEHGGLGGANPDRGRFRSYLLGAMKHFMANDRQRRRAIKRGGSRRLVSIDTDEIESHISMPKERTTVVDADRAFDRTWARETTAAALRELEEEWASRGKLDHFVSLRPALSADLAERAEVATRLGMTENALAVAIHRFRQRYAALVREAVARTVAREADIDDELQYLIEILRER
ncbi:MAG: hypothetical protein AAF937_01920 [Planctomycetota bacterium]